MNNKIKLIVAALIGAATMTMAITHLPTHSSGVVTVQSADAPQDTTATTAQEIPTTTTTAMVTLPVESTTSTTQAPAATTTTIHVTTTTQAHVVSTTSTTLAPTTTSSVPASTTSTTQRPHVGPPNTNRCKIANDSPKKGQLQWTSRLTSEPDGAFDLEITMKNVGDNLIAAQTKQAKVTFWDGSTTSFDLVPDLADYCPFEQVQWIHTVTNPAGDTTTKPIVEIN